MKKQLLIIILLFSSVFLFGQRNWEKTTTNKSDDVVFVKSHTPSSFQLYQLDIAGLKSQLETIASTKNQNLRNASFIIELPSENGKPQRFKLLEDSILDEGIAAMFPMIKTYVGQGIDDPTATVRISIGTDGFHAMIMGVKTGTQLIDPYTRDRSKYILYSASNLPAVTDEFFCEVEDEVDLSSIDMDKLHQQYQRNYNDGKVRTYNLAIACTIQYAGYHLTNQNVPANATLLVKKAAVLSAIVNTINRVQSIYEKELAVKFTIINNNADIIFIDADNFNNNNNSLLIGQSQSVIDDVIGNANYDIGHTFTTGNGGTATFGGICTIPTPGIDSWKARAFSGSSDPIGDLYSVDFVAHEMGHHFGAKHTYNGGGIGSCTTRHQYTSAEPGSGSTIMGYTGICGSLNIQDPADPYFHIFSLMQIYDRLHNIDSPLFHTSWDNFSSFFIQCGVEANTNNNEPLVEAGNSYTIPKSTAFKLHGVGSDPDGDAISYSWEQIDVAYVPHPLVTTNALIGPAYRSYPATTSPDRFMPKFETVFNDRSVTNQWEMTPSVARTMKFNLTVRDNKAIGGQYAFDDMTVTTSGTAGPFVVTSQTTSETWATGDNKTITWDVAGTTANNINEANVRISLVDETGTELAELMASTLNDGSVDITVPDVTNSNARVMVAAINNIFYALNSGAIAINAVPAYCNNVCPSRGANDGTLFEITSVKFNTIDNTSSDTVANDYSDYTNISTDINRGSTYDLTIKHVTVGGYSYRIVAWIDWNRDCDFDDANEEFRFTSDNVAENDPETLSIPVPANASLGETRMRIAIRYDNTTYSTSCQLDINTGEVEDYNVNITDTALTVLGASFENSIHVYPNPTKGEFTIDLGNNYNNTTVLITDLLGRTIFKKEYLNTLQKIDMQLNVANGTYIAVVKTEKGEKAIFKILINK